MSLSRIQRINIDSTNFEYNNTFASLRVSLQNPIVKVPEAYNVVLEKAEVPISQIPLNVLNTPYYIMIDYPTSMPDHPVLEKKLNIFTIQGKYYSTTEFLNMVNKIIHYDLLPAVSCGLFGYNTDNRIEYKFGDVAQRNSMTGGVEVWFDSRLIFLLDKIPTLYTATPDSTISSTLKMHKLDWSSFLGADPGIVIKEQTEYLIPRLYGFKSIRITSSLPTQPYVVYNQMTNKSEYSNLFAEIMMDSQNYIEGRTNQLYVPQNLIFSELKGVAELKDFTFGFNIHYKNGHDEKLSVGPDEYLSLTLGFYKIKDY